MRPLRKDNLEARLEEVTRELSRNMRQMQELVIMTQTSIENGGLLTDYSQVVASCVTSTLTGNMALYNELTSLIQKWDGA
jgi:hypothetical protein